MKQPISLVWMQNWGRILTLPSSRGAFLSFFCGKREKMFRNRRRMFFLIVTVFVFRKESGSRLVLRTGFFITVFLFLSFVFSWKSSVLFGISLEINMNRLFAFGVPAVCNSGGAHHPFGRHNASSIRIFILFKNNLLDSGLYECFCTFVAGKEGRIDPGPF